MEPSKTVRYYTGVGSRLAPSRELEWIERFATMMAKTGWVLRSGKAKGCDTAFEVGCDSVGGSKEIYTPRDYISSKAFEIAAEHHPVWNKLNPFAQFLMARNVHAVLGRDLDSPSECLVCWTADGVVGQSSRSITSGGTGHTVSVAESFGVPVFNMGRDGDRARLMSWLEKEMDYE